MKKLDITDEELWDEFMYNLKKNSDKIVDRVYRTTLLDCFKKDK